MRTQWLTLAALATMSAGAAFSQDANQAGTPVQPAPITRNYYGGSNGQAAPAARRPAGPRVSKVQLAQGVWLRSTGVTQTISATPDKIEVRVDHGVANLNVHHPAEHAQILVDLPGGQVDVLKDGFYTFNAETNTERTLKGEAEIYPTANTGAKGMKVKEDHAFSFASMDAKPYAFGPMDLRSDLLPGAVGPQGEGYERGYGYGRGYGFAPYGDGYPGGYYGSPYWAYGPGFGPYWGDPFFGPGFGYGIGFGYYGGFGRFGGFRR